jgi:hypothetical protein
MQPSSRKTRSSSFSNILKLTKVENRALKLDQDIEDFDRLQVSKERIGPEKAKEYLSYNFEDNREHSPSKVSDLATEMRQNRFFISDSAICFSGGFLINGQHRLRAVLEGNTVETFIVCRDMPSNSMEIMDIGRRRTKADRITVMGTKMSVKECASVMHCLADLNRTDIGSAQFNHQRHDHLVKSYFEKHSQFFELIAERGLSSKPKTMIVSAALKIYVQMYHDMKIYKHGMTAIERALHWIYLTTNAISEIGNTDAMYDRAAIKLHQKIRQNSFDSTSSSRYWADMKCWKMTINAAHNFMKGEAITRITPVKIDPFRDFKLIKTTNRIN